MILRDCNAEEVKEVEAEYSELEDQDEDALEIENLQNAELVTFSTSAMKHIGAKVKPTQQDVYTRIGEKYNMCFKLVKSDSRLVKTLLFSYGFIQCSSKNANCNLFWTNAHVGSHTLRALKPWQRINHFPRSFMITKKDTLYYTIDRAIVQYGDCFKFIPEYYCTPLSEEKAAELKSKCVAIENGSAPPFIVKPASSSRGRDISFIKRPEDVDHLESKEKLLISRYIDRPYLINELKSDLRVYVLVTSFHPLIAYVYDEGLARFAVHKYDDSNRRDYDNVNAHLTNYSLNKSSQDFVKNSEASSEDLGHKWTLSAFLRRIEADGVDTQLLMVRIEDIIIKTLLSIQTVVAASCRKLNLHPRCCFELFGFDILVDQELKPWLLEVNLSPSLVCDAPLDSILKSKLLCDTLNVASIPLVCDRNAINKCADEDSDYFTGSSSPCPSNATVSAASVSDATTAAADSQTSAAATASSSVDSGVLKSDSATSIVDSTTGEPVRTAKERSPPRKKKVNARVCKVRRASLNSKANYSAENVTSAYVSRSRAHFDKVLTEDERKGGFIRVFPRRSTWTLYSGVMDDVGQEKWDENLHEMLSMRELSPDITARDIAEAHEQLVDAAKYPRRENLSPMVRDVLLKEQLDDAAVYKEQFYENVSRPYPMSLPRVRIPARKRTRSMLASEELRKASEELKKQAQAATEATEKVTI
ncbi:tubulin-tyrosine ligase [Aphelenchoides avenae]|nr:tubulin-tyrosine ligase [Aphelenchus avenae]